MKFGFIGCGNMGGALAKALAHSTKDILISDRSGNAKPLAAELGCVYGSVAEAAGCEFVFLGVKPQMMAGVLSPLQPIFAEKKPILVSMAAGLSLAQIEGFAGTSLPIIRIMPNTPCAVGKGMIPYCYNSLVTEEMLCVFLRDMAHAGCFDPIEERLMEAATAVAGCGPAFMYMFIEAMADGGVACGLPRASALEFAAQMVAGSAKLILESGKHPGVLKDAVCSPGGTTIQGVRALEAGNFRGTVMEAVIKAYEKNFDLK